MTEPPYRSPGAPLILPEKAIEVPTVADKRYLLDAVAIHNGTTIDPAMHEKRYTQILGVIIESMDEVIQLTSRGIDCTMYFDVPYLRSELVEGKENCQHCRKEWGVFVERLKESFSQKGWYLYIGLTDSVFQPWDFAFWRKTRMVQLTSAISLKPL